MDNDFIGGQVLNVFTDDEIKNISKVLSYLKDAHNAGNVAHAYTNGFTEKDPIYSIMNKLVFTRLKEVVGIDTHVACGMYLKEFNPWGIHTDYTHKFDNGRTPDVAFLIPLEIIGPPNAMTHTVVFEQPSKDLFDDFEEYMHGSAKLDPNAKELYSTHCSHISEAGLEYVTLKGAYAWLPGSVIYWDRELLHSSDNFIKNGITEKRALVLFTTKEA